MHASLPSLLRQRPPPMAVGVLAGIACVVVETLLIYLLRQVAPASSLGVFYLLGVLVVSTVWGLGPGAATAAASTFAYDYFHLPPFSGGLAERGTRSRGHRERFAGEPRRAPKNRGRTGRAAARRDARRPRSPSARGVQCGRQRDGPHPGNEIHPHDPLRVRRHDDRGRQLDRSQGP